MIDHLICNILVPFDVIIILV